MQGLSSDLSAAALTKAEAHSAKEENRSDKKSRRVKRPDGNKKFSGMEAAYLRSMAKRGIMATLLPLAW